MNKRQARKIAKSGITAGQICEMLDRALADGAADNTPSTVNHQFTKAQVYDMYITFEKIAPGTRIRGGNAIAATNALRDFGEYWE